MQKADLRHVQHCIHIESKRSIVMGNDKCGLINMVHLSKSLGVFCYDLTRKP